VLIRGSNGIFDVAADDEIIFSKDEAGRFPSHAEIIDALQRADGRRTRPGG